ncbi:MAG TPA: phenylalanine--tRNA ligase subunit beta [Candidatus Nanoperiomorbaceae bacterium]|nr:phenylalanine--tRNA ligase subunit beta [Candidatus Nanoperiomorbaceae bacterium]HMQ96486.1 phenylalanine--tRNA ligase subunit beta [Candidatus Nanoperiomorbaceae bacterium]HMR85903.1 phenylalanine--tRNA ligase subunit beta [Candidatus Nanoperiomorbaceae bacterium]HMU11758.1 phenylalanine--tRNA ligase subunit beta [Candidatus Nanoperiomorbaceae bacterium]
MIVSVNWLKKYVAIDRPIDELAELVGARLVEIEEVINLGAKYQDVIVAKVIEAGPVPDSDHLNLCKIDDGGVRKDVERDENGLIQVVCGAPNVRAGLLVAWLPPNTVVPETYGTAEPFVLGARKLRGFMSNGMIASARELDLWDEHDGILEIDREARVGDSFAKLYELDDYLLDIENKSLTHRPDCFGLIGLAREIAAIQGEKFTSPDWLMTLDPKFSKTAGLQQPTVTITDPKICARYQGVVLADVDSSARSDILTSSYLARSGMRPISAAVDITNWLMLVTGQPLHVFDYDKLLQVSGSDHPEIVVRSGRDNEKMTLLDGREIELDPEDIVITAGEKNQKPVALAGAMGGSETEIDDSTKNIFLESATFNLYNLRGTQFRHGIFSEAITRFTKGQPAALTAPVLAEAAQMFADQTGAAVASDVADAYPAPTEPVRLTMSESQIASVLTGTDYEQSIITSTLNNLEYVNVMVDHGQVSATAPWWRTDIHIKEDVIEDLGRVNGYDTIEPTLPLRDFTATAPSTFDLFRDNVRSNLARAGGNEVLTYSFVPAALIEKVGSDPTNAYRITNAISPELQHYRLNIFPGLLDKATANFRAGYDDFLLFELGKTHAKDRMDEAEPEVPAEIHMLSAVLVAKDPADKHSSIFYQMKKIVEFVIGRSDLYVQPLSADVSDYGANAFEPKRSGALTIANGTIIGVIGELKQSVRRAFKLPDHTAVLELNIDMLFEMQTVVNTYKPLSKYPSVERDLTLQVAADMAYKQVIDVITNAFAQTDLAINVEPLSMYQGDDDTTKNISFRLTFTASDRTLSGDEIATVMAKLTDAVTRDLNAKVI